MQVFVDLYSEGTIAADVDSEATLGDLRWALRQVTPEAVAHRYSYFSFHGKALQDSRTISSCGIRNQSTLQCRVRVLGGGGDGGATGAESRDCYLNMYATKKPDRVDPNEARLAKWSQCTFSSETLRPPCVVDLLGNLYNKEALVAGLLSKSLPTELKHIKGLRDMVSIHLSSIPGVDARDDVPSHTKFQCPIGGQEFNGKHRFYVLRGCGHVLSRKALKEVPSSSCLVCFVPYTESDKIAVNGTEEEVLALRQRMEEEVSKKKERKQKTASKDAAAEETVSGSTQSLTRKEGEETDAVDLETHGANGTKRKGSKVDKDKLPLIEKVKDQKSLQPSKRFKAVDMLPVHATKEVYASIFSSSSTTKVKETYMCRALPLGRN